MASKRIISTVAVLVMTLWLFPRACQAEHPAVMPGHSGYPGQPLAPGPPPKAQLGELEQLAVDIARRTLLSFCPHAGHNPIRTAEVMVRPEGDAVHTYARLIWYTRRNGRKRYQSEVFASLVYTPGVRRVFDLSYKDNCGLPHRTFNRTADMISKINEELERRDPLRLPHPLVGPHLDQLAPRKPSWPWNPLGGDHPWHVSIADDRLHPAWFPFFPRPNVP